MARFPARRALTPVGLVAGAVGLIAAEPLVLRELRTGSSVVPGSRVSAGAHHGHALALLVLGGGGGGGGGGVHAERAGPGRRRQRR